MSEKNIYIKKDTGEEFELERHSCTVSGDNKIIDLYAVTKIKRKFPWKEVAKGVFIKSMGGQVLLCNCSRSSGDILDTENWQYWGQNHQGYDGAKCPLPGDVEVMVELHPNGNVVTQKAKDACWNYVTRFKVVGLPEDVEY